MHYQIVSCVAIASLLINGLPICGTPASSISESTYYVDLNHPQAEDELGHGTIDKPWKTPAYAFQQLKPGDTLLIRGGTYQTYAATLTEKNSGREGMPITIKAYPGETVFLTDDWSIKFHGANWWTIEGLVFDKPKSQYIQLGLHTYLGHDRTVAAEHITIRNCEFKNGERVAIRAQFANHILIENNYFHHIRPGVPFRTNDTNITGWETNAIDIAYKANDIVITNNRFEDIGSDGVHLGAQFYVTGAEIGAVSIFNNEFWVNRPYEGILGNVSENAIDIKKVNGPILISGNSIHGFRPTTPEQDASGAHGDGIVIHNNARNIIIERNLFDDNTFHLVISQGTRGTPGGTRDIVVRNNIFKEARKSENEGGYALSIDSAANIEVYHNTFYYNRICVAIHSATGVFENNVVVGGSSRVSTDSKWEADYNAWIVADEQCVVSCLRGKHDLWVGDPLLDADLRPLPDSPLINAGDKVEVPNDFNGYLRADGLPDLGAIEHKYLMLLSFMYSQGQP